jgi:ABC-type sugar transport system substrate-binding protein
LVFSCLKRPRPLVSQRADHPLLVQAVKAAIPAVQIDYTNANGNTNTQLTQAEADLAKGACILIVGAHDSVAAAAIVTKARATTSLIIISSIRMLARWALS